VNRVFITELEHRPPPDPGGVVLENFAAVGAGAVGGCTGLVNCSTLVIGPAKAEQQEDRRGSVSAAAFALISFLSYGKFLLMFIVCLVTSEKVPFEGKGVKTAKMLTHFSFRILCMPLAPAARFVQLIGWRIRLGVTGGRRRTSVSRKLKKMRQAAME
jgi:hypothetical protein